MEELEIAFKDVNTAVLSNLFPHEFSVGGVTCKSMEGFLQSLKFDDEAVQETVQRLWGLDAYKAGRATDWRKEQVLFWKGKTINRHGKEYQELLDRAYGIEGEEGLAKNPLFALALKGTKGKRLIHVGVDDTRESILTPAEYISRLNRLREMVLNKNKEKDDGFNR